MNQNTALNTWLDRPVFTFWPKFTIYHLFVTLILLTTIFSRFIMLGERVMSHDEVNHVVPAYTFYTGGGYRYDPVTHGPLQFHLIALSYALFGDSDFSARIPDALFGIAVVTFAIFAFRRYLGRVGSLIAGFLFTISPYISFYSRYTRNEIYIVFWGMALLWGVLNYLEFGRKRTLLFITVITALHFTDKATSYIFTAELLIFLAIIFIARLMFKSWRSKKFRLASIITVVVIFALGLVLFGFGYTTLSNAPQPSEEESVGVMFNQLPVITRVIIGGLGLAILMGLVLTAIFVVKGLGWKSIRDERSFDLLMMQGTIVLPLLAALPMDILGFNPMDYTSRGILISAAFILPLFIISLLIGLWWNWKTWALNIGIFWAIFILFYTSLFTQGSGFPMGLMGALGYWMAQQGVTRGTQPLYYYALVQIPMYEFLPAFGTILAAIMGIPLIKLISRKKETVPPDFITTDDIETPETDQELDEIFLIQQVHNSIVTEEEVPESEEDHEDDLLEDYDEDDYPSEPVDIDNEGIERKSPVLGLLLFWSLMSLVAFSFAGERMPWLTTHIAMPMILTSGWSFGKLLESFDWEPLKRFRGWLIIIVGFIFLLATLRTFGVLLSPTPPFQGNELSQLEATSTFLLALIGMVASALVLANLLKDWSIKQLGKFALILFVGVLSVITIRTSFRANFILYDTAKEFLVYAHATRDPKDVLEQVEEISHRTTGGKDIVVAYDSDLLYPYWWYFRDYPNKRWYSGNPTRDLRDASIILVGSGNYGLIDPVVGNDYMRFDYLRLWWPSQAYFNLTFERAWNAISNPQMRSALWQIWLNRDYEPYANLAAIDTLTLENWQPSDSFRMYIRKDVVSQIWEYGATPVALEPEVDPYEANTVVIDAGVIISSDDQRQFDAPRDIAIAPDGTLYVADSRNHRILHFDSDGNYLSEFGQFGASDYNTNVMAPGGYFNEPWGIAVSPDGSIYVADTWNNRIQKFDENGNFLTMWGQFGAAESAYHFWGPRGVAIDNQGRVFVTDTGNKRVVIFDSNGQNLAVFGGAGMGVGQFDEPVGIEVDEEGRLYIADTWNSRVQIMLPQDGELFYPNNITWDVDAWYSESLENKPFLAIDIDKNTYVTDPVMGRVLVFDSNGVFLRAFGGFGAGPSEIGIAGGIAIDTEGNIWISDALNNRLMRFTLPEQLTNPESSADQFILDENNLGEPLEGMEEDNLNP
jgi:predicted membrane-bound mannosyltransferase/DNA-binding beta-propeller fold protein YncE